jgi:hypothetical protein
MALQCTCIRRKNNAGVYNCLCQRSRIGEREKHATVRRRLGVAAKALNIPLTIKRSGTDVYFWKEDKGNEQPRAKRSYTRRAIGREETTEPDQPFSASEEVDHEATLEESPELGQTPV